MVKLKNNKSMDESNNLRGQTILVRTGKDKRKEEYIGVVTKKSFQYFKD